MTPTPTATPMARKDFIESFYLDVKEIKETYSVGLIWDDVIPRLNITGIDIKGMSVQPFVIRSDPFFPFSSPIICSGFLLVPSEPGMGYVVYENADGIQFVQVTFDIDEVEYGVFPSFKGTTPILTNP